MHPPADHKDIYVHDTFPEGISEAEKALRIAWFWQSFDSPFREAVVREMEEHPDYFFNVSMGIQVAILRGLLAIDLEKLDKELEDADLLLESREFPTEIFPERVQE